MQTAFGATPNTAEDLLVPSLGRLTVGAGLKSQGEEMAFGRSPKSEIRGLSSSHTSSQRPPRGAQGVMKVQPELQEAKTGLLEAN